MSDHDISNLGTLGEVIIIVGALLVAAAIGIWQGWRDSRGKSDDYDSYDGDNH